MPFSTAVPELTRPVRAACQASVSTTGALESAPPESIWRESCIDPSTRLTSTSVTRYPVDSDVSVTSRWTRACGSEPPTVAASGPERSRAVVRSVDSSEPTSRLFRPGATNTYSAAIASSVIEKNISARRVLSDSLNRRGRIAVWCRSRRRLATIRPSGLGVSESVADAADREHEFGVLGVELDLLAQVADVDVDRALVAVGRVAPDPRQQHVAGEHPARRARQCRQQLELDVGQLDVVAADPHGPFREVDSHLADLKRTLIGTGQCRPRHLRSPQRRLDPAGELAQRERLGDVVVGAELEPDDLVDLLGLGRQHDDRHRAAAPQLPADLEPIDPRQHQVEHDEVERLLVEALQRLAAVGRLHHVVALLPQWVGEQGLDRLLIVDEQDACWVIGHGGLL